MKLVKYKDIYFLEDNIPNIKILKHISTKIDGFFFEAQLCSLTDVKEKMYVKAKSYKANCIINFKYGQKSSFFSSIFSLDDTHWYGEGDLVHIDDDELKKNVSFIIFF